MFRRFWRAMGVFGCGREFLAVGGEFSSGSGSFRRVLALRAGWGAGGLVCGGVRAAGWGAGWGQFDVFEKYIFPENVEFGV